jgi:hypothetical protein
MATVRVLAASRAWCDGRFEPDAATLAQVGPLPLADLDETPDGWLARLTALSGAPVVLVPTFVRWPPVLCGVPVTQDAPAFELDAFAVASVYETVVWDDRAPFWHRDAGRPDSAALLRALHDLALRAYRNHDAGERLVVIRAGT